MIEWEIKMSYKPLKCQHCKKILANLDQRDGNYLFTPVHGKVISSQMAKAGLDRGIYEYEGDTLYIKTKAKMLCPCGKHTTFDWQVSIFT